MGGSLRQRKKGKSKYKNSNVAEATVTAAAASAAALKMPSAKRRKILAATVMSILLLFIVVVTLLVVSPWNSASASDTPIKESLSEEEEPRRTRIGSFELLETVSHDARAFTQGLLTVADSNGSLKLYESTGMYGDSELRLLDFEGNILSRHHLPPEFFAEGIVHFPGNDDELRLIQLTWRETTSFEYVLQTNDGALLVQEPLGNWTFRSTTDQGWGITYSPGANVFYMTDGSQYLHTWDMASRKEISKVPVRYQTKAMDNPRDITDLNELEYDPATNTVLSNVWFQDILVRIDIETGFVPTIYDLTALFPKAARPTGTDVFNGIALSYDVLKATPATATDEFWVTGKYWPYMFRIRLIEPTE